MIPNEELRTKLRSLIDEVIPPGKLDTDTRFDDCEIDTILSEAATLMSAASEGWLRKAARAMSERGGLEEAQAGDERHKFVSLEKYRDHCLVISEMYAKKAGKRSLLLALEPPPVYEGEPR